MVVEVWCACTEGVCSVPTFAKTKARKEKKQKMDGCSKQLPPDQQQAPVPRLQPQQHTQGMSESAVDD